LSHRRPSRRRLHASEHAPAGPGSSLAAAPAEAGCPSLRFFLPNQSNKPDAGLDGGAPLSELQARLAAATGVPASRQELLSGFPPRPLPLGDAGAPLASLGLANGDTITVREAAGSSGGAPPPAAEAPGGAAAAAGAPPAAAVSQEDAELARALAASLSDLHHPRAAAAPAPPAAAASSSAPPPAATSTGPAPTSVRLPDGSCVVRCARAPELRRVIASAVAADPETYSEAFLGRPNPEYQAWIQGKDRWGGAIELAILSGHYGREIAAYDISTQRCDVYGSDCSYGERIMLLYDGLHYECARFASP